MYGGSLVLKHLFSVRSVCVCYALCFARVAGAFDLICCLMLPICSPQNAKLR